jgi:hypothetical protein
MAAAAAVGHVVTSRYAAWPTVLALCAVSAHGAQYTVAVAGLGGEPEYQQRFDRQAKQLGEAAARADGAERVSVLVGTQATRAGLQKRLHELAAQVGPQDRFTLVLFGHGSYDEDYRFNVGGPDIGGSELSNWLNAIPSRRQLVVLASSASGGAMQRLQAEHRIVVTATKSGGERNATRFGEYFVQALASSEADRDKNEWVTAQEAYDFAARKVADSFKNAAALATEHARIEGRLAASFPLGRLGTSAEMPSDPQLLQLFAQRLAVETDLDAVKARKQDMDVDAYYTELERVLIKLAQTQQRIDARQAALGGKSGGRAP